MCCCAAKVGSSLRAPHDFLLRSMGIDEPHQWAITGRQQQSLQAWCFVSISSVAHSSKVPYSLQTYGMLDDFGLRLKQNNTWNNWGKVKTWNGTKEAKVLVCHESCLCHSFWSSTDYTFKICPNSKTTTRTCSKVYKMIGVIEILWVGYSIHFLRVLSDVLSFLRQTDLKLEL